MFFLISLTSQLICSSCLDDSLTQLHSSPTFLPSFLSFLLPTPPTRLGENPECSSSRAQEPPSGSLGHHANPQGPRVSQQKEESSPSPSRTPFHLPGHVPSLRPPQHPTTPSLLFQAGAHARGAHPLVLGPPFQDFCKAQILYLGFPHSYIKPSFYKLKVLLYPTAARLVVIRKFQLLHALTPTGHFLSLSAAVLWIHGGMVPWVLASPS